MLVLLLLMAMAAMPGTVIDAFGVMRIAGGFKQPQKSQQPHLPDDHANSGRQGVAFSAMHMVADSETAEQAAAKALDRAAKLRAEIAALENKSVEQVEQEAKQKKDDEKKRMMEMAAKDLETKKKSAPPRDFGRMLEVPSRPEDMVAQAALAVERAYQAGITRQTVRLALVNPPDQSCKELNQWPGGAPQMYRESAKPLTHELLKNIRLSKEQKMKIQAPNVTDQDIWDFDGSGLFTSRAQEGAAHDVQALVFANTDVKYINDIQKIDEAMKDRLFLLVNPFWRNIDSWGINILAPGAKKKAQKVIFDKGYDETYVFLRFSARSEECVAIKAYPYDWQIFAYLENDMGWETPVRLGSSVEEPTTALVTELLNERPEFKLTRTMRQFRR